MIEQLDKTARNLIFFLQVFPFIHDIWHNFNKYQMVLWILLAALTWPLKFHIKVLPYFVGQFGFQISWLGFLGAEDSHY